MRFAMSAPRPLMKPNGVLRLLKTVYGRLCRDSLVIWIGHFRTRQARAFRYRHRPRSEEHTSELQSRPQLVCRLLLEKKQCLTSECWSNHEVTSSTLLASTFLRSVPPPHDHFTLSLHDALPI